MESTASTRARTVHARRPAWLWLGLALILVSWPLNWLLPGLRTHVLFFPLWLGYVLAVDGLVLSRRGSSLLQRNPAAWVSLFLISAPAWWLFELFNWRTENWIYLGREHFSNLTYFLLASLSFSTVMPAVFETAELVRSFGWVERLRPWRRVSPSRSTLRMFLAVGVALVLIIMAWPKIFYPFIWASVFFILSPINAWLGHRSLLHDLDHRDWRPVVSLALGALICGFFWEMWNFFAYPKWTYDTPGVNFLHVFEMPLLGYIGYPPFALELYALLHLVHGRKKVLEL